MGRIYKIDKSKIQCFIDQFTEILYHTLNEVYGVRETELEHRIERNEVNDDVIVLYKRYNHLYLEMIFKSIEGGLCKIIADRKDDVFTGIIINVNGIVDKTYRVSNATNRKVRVVDNLDREALGDGKHIGNDDWVIVHLDYNKVPLFFHKVAMHLCDCISLSLSDNIPGIEDSLSYTSVTPLNPNNQTVVIGNTSNNETYLVITGKHIGNDDWVIEFEAEDFIYDDPEIDIYNTIYHTYHNKHFTFNV